MRAGAGGGTTGLKWLLTDHLGSTHKMAYADGTNYTTQLYKAWGEQRYPPGSSALLTTYRYTGQREESYINLYWYGSRWYDPELGRWIQPDTIIPLGQGVQAFDRYTYVNNSPVRYIDPSGHRIEENGGNINLSDYYPLVRLNGFNYSERITIESAASEVATKFAATAESFRQYWNKKLNENLPVVTPQQAFYLILGGPVKWIRKNITATDYFFPHHAVLKHIDYGMVSKAWGYTISATEIWVFANATPQDVSSTLYFPTHEFGHAFDLSIGMLGRSSITTPFYENNLGYARGIVQNPDCGPNNRHEVFANMFTGWVFNGWTAGWWGQARQSFMNNLMPGLIVP